MQVLRGLEHLTPLPRPSAVAIGNFDGLHLGHQKILRTLVHTALGNNLSSLVLTFSPHPEKILGRSRIAMIQTLSQRLAGLRSFGIQSVLVTPFDRAFAELTKGDFICDIIVSLLQAKEVIVGDNFRFGRNREGRIADLRQLGRQFGFRVHSIPALIHNGHVISSSLIRTLLEGGEVEKACLLLGRPYQIEGRVVKGSSRGTILGIPTANIRAANEILPPGVFGTLARVEGCACPSVTNIGHRPTFGRQRLQVETHIFDFTKSIYRKKVVLFFFKRLREERAFPSPKALVGQIKKDIRDAREFFRKNPHLTDRGG